jgi:hypothetical protein
MGAYENPVTVVDTQSGQIWANAIMNLGASASKVLDNERERLLEENKDFSIRLKKIQEQGVKDFDFLSTALEQKGLTSDQIYDQAQRFQTEKTNASIKLLQTGRPAEELAEAQKKYNSSDRALKGLLPYLKDRSSSMEDYLTEIKNNPINVGGQGFASMTENQEFQIGTWIDTGFLKGTKEIIYDEQKGWGTKYTESPDVTPTGKMADYDGKEFMIWGTQAANYMTTKVPTVDKTLKGLLINLDIVDKNNKLTEKYQKIKSDQTRSRKSTDGTITSLEVGADWEQIAFDINYAVEQQADGYLQNPKTANAVWRNVFGQKEDMEIVDGGGIDPKQALDFRKRLKMRAGQYIPDVDFIAATDKKAEQWIQSNPEAFKIKKFASTPKEKSSDKSSSSDKIKLDIKVLQDLQKIKYPKTDKNNIDFNSSQFSNMLANKGYKVTAPSEQDGVLYIDIKNNDTKETVQISNQMTDLELNSTLAKLAGIDPMIVDKVFDFSMGPKDIDQFDFSQFKVNN